jgi:hypothetical protein
MSPMDPRKEKARQIAAVYAPAPEASALVYGIVGVALFSVGIWGAGRFYALPLTPHFALLVAGSVVAFCVAVWLRNKRRRHHVDAYQAELVRLGGQPRS